MNIRSILMIILWGDMEDWGTDYKIFIDAIIDGMPKARFPPKN